MTDLRHAATFLFVPGDRPERFAKAASSGADAIILDLEDAVAPDAKDRARAAVRSFLEGGGPAVVRVNAVDTPWFADDTSALTGVAPAGIVLPKAEDAQALQEMAARFPGAMLLPLVETAKGFAALSRLAATTASIGRFVFGTIDFQVDLGIEGEGEELLAFRSELVLRSRLAEIAPPVDGVSLSIDDPDGLSFESRRARRLGFGGKLCIHPRQVPVVAAVFRPSDDEVQRALRIVEAADTSRSGVVVVDGRMVDRPVVALARNTLLRASAAPSSNRLTMD